MPYLGRYQPGQTIPILFVCRNGSRTPSEPTRAPTLTIWDNTSRIVSGTKVSIQDRYGATGLFMYPLFLNATYPAGRYRVTKNWNISTYTGIEEDAFEVLAGGDVNGHVQSMAWAEFPHANFLVHHLEDGTLVFGRNPKV